MRQQVRDHRSELLAGWWGGFTVGGVSGIKIFLLQMNPMSFPTEFALKLIGTVILSCVGGIFGMLARDLYTHWIKPKIKSFNQNTKNNVGQTQ